MIGEKKKSFFKEFLDSWVGRLSRWVLVALIIACGLLYFELFPFNSLSSYLSEDKYGYTFKMMEIAVSILAFAALVWSISYQRDELLQSREELKIQSEDVNRSIDEANKNFDRELLLEFYREVSNEINSIDFIVSSFLVESQYRIYRDTDEDIVEEIQDCIGKIGFTSPELQRLLSQIQSEADFVGADDSDYRWQFQHAYSKSHIKSALGSVKESLHEVESGVLILLYDMILYAKYKKIPLGEPVFSLLKTALKRSGFFINSKTQEHRLSGQRFNQICMDIGLIETTFSDDGVPTGRKFKNDELSYFIDSLHSLGVIGNKERFVEMLAFS